MKPEKISKNLPESDQFDEVLAGNLNKNNLTGFWAKSDQFEAKPLSNWSDSSHFLNIFCLLFFASWDNPLTILSNLGTNAVERNDRHATAQQKKDSGLEGHLLAYSPPLLSDISSHGGGFLVARAAADCDGMEWSAALH